MQAANNWRDRFWIFARRKHPENEVLTRWLTVVRWVLFPLDTFFWHHHDTHGYVWERDTWFMYGAKFHGNDIRSLAKADGKTYKITRIGDTIQFVLVEDYTAANPSLALEWAQHAYQLEVERIKRQINLAPPPIRERGSDQHNDRQQQAGGESGKPFVEDEPDKAEDHRG